MQRNNFIFIFVFSCALACLSGIGTLEAQTVAPQNTTAAPHEAGANFRVAGTIVSAATGHPLARARVSLTNTRKPQDRRSATSSDEGHFEFTQVAAGKYSLEGAKTGFIERAYDQHEEFSTAIVTGAGPGIDTENLVLSLDPAAVLSVKVLDESGEPVRKASVTLYWEDRRSGVRRVIVIANNSTDDQGSCEFTRLRSGTYFASVTATPWYAIHPVSTRVEGQANSPPMDLHSFDVTYPLTYYGDSIDADSASPILIKGGDHAEAEIHLSPVPALHLLFHVAENGQRGFSIPSLQKSAFGAEQFQPNVNTQQVAPGLFEITGVAPGRYTVRMPGGAPGDLDITSSGQDLSQVTGEPVSNLKATVRILGGGSLPEMLAIRPANGDERNTQFRTVDKNGEVTFTDVTPGAYEVLARGATKRYSVMKVSVQGGETASHTLNIPSGSSLTASISVAEGSENVEGFAKRAGKAAPGAMIVLVPHNPESNRELFRRDQSDLDGSFTLIGVPSGSYTVVAIEDGWNLDWAVPSVIEPYALHGERVRVGAGSGQSNSRQSTSPQEASGQSVKLLAPVEVQAR